MQSVRGGGNIIKRIVGILVCILLIFTILPKSANIIVDRTYDSTIFGNTLYVGGNGPNNYSKIQNAIDNTSSGDTIFVFNGTYYENIVIFTTINLEGESKSATIIDGGSVGNVITVFAQYVNISNFTITNKEDVKISKGIRLEADSNYCKIDNNIIKVSNIGIFIRSDFNTISNNQIIYNQYVGIHMSYCSSNTIQGNIISKNWIGIDTLSVDSCIIKDNNISSNNLSIKFVESMKNTVIDNTISHNYMGFLVFESIFNTIKKNNFICNYEYHAYFETSYNRWTQNYWDDYLGFGFKPIKGEMYHYEWLGWGEDPIEISIPWIQFDWHPAREPYDIPT